RFCAMAIDVLFMWLVAFCLVIMAAVLNVAADALDTIGDFGPEGEGVGGWITWVNALVLALVFVLLFGYYVFFEMLLHGQTPGKRALKIRVIRDDGTPMGGMDVVVRNLIRAVDFLPVFYGLGGLVMFFSSMHKRLGDIAAGTIVVKEAALDYRASADKKYVVPAMVAPVGNRELTPAERRVLTGFVRRRGELLPEARLQLAQRLAMPLFEKHGGHYGDPESYIERLLQGRQHES
ncbi:MAG: RDD family protein, partial [Phycisphaerae bacterium]|nr:RDD family protein [Phycisphaerae bacterium]